MVKELFTSASGDLVADAMSHSRAVPGALVAISHRAAGGIAQHIPLSRVTSLELRDALALLSPRAKTQTAGIVAVAAGVGWAVSEVQNRKRNADPADIPPVPLDEPNLKAWGTRANATGDVARETTA